MMDRIGNFSAYQPLNSSSISFDGSLNSDLQKSLRKPARFDLRKRGETATDTFSTILSNSPQSEKRVRVVYEIGPASLIEETHGFTPQNGEARNIHWGALEARNGSQNGLETPETMSRVSANELLHQELANLLECKVTRSGLEDAGATGALNPENVRQGNFINDKILSNSL